MKSLAYNVGDRVEFVHPKTGQKEIGKVSEILSDKAPNRMYAIELFGTSHVFALSGNKMAFVSREAKV